MITRLNVQDEYCGCGMNQSDRDGTIITISDIGAVP